MMTISPIASSHGYYENNPEGNYYLDDQLQSKFIGKGAEDLGINNQQVDKDIQDYLMKGILPTGETIKRFDSKHRAGYDLTFSAPKSVSVLSLVVGDTRLIEAHKNAVEQTIGEIEKLASVRNKINGNYVITNTDNLIVALHTHDTSREQDPQLHTHALVFNLTKNSDGDWQSLSSDRINKTGFIESVYINQIAFGTIYRQILRNEVEKMGFKTINTSKGLWEIEGVPTEEFSKRRAQIVNDVGENATAKEREISTLETRKFKEKVDKNILHEKWNKTLERTEFNKNDFYNNINSKELIIHTKDTQKINYDAVSKSIEILSDNKGQFSYQEILNQSISLSAKNQGAINEIKQGIDLAIENSLIIPLDKNKSIFVSDISLEREQKITESNNILLDRKNNFNKHNIYSEDKGISNFFLDKNKIGIFTGRANFATQIKRFQELNSVAKTNNLVPIIVVQSNKIKLKYAENGIKNIISINQLDNEKINDKTFLIIDEAESLSLKNFEKLLKVSVNNNSSLAVLNSKTNIGIGNSIELLKKNGTKEYQFSIEDKSETLIKIESIEDKNIRYKQLVKDFVNEQNNNGNAIIIANSQKEKQTLNSLTRNELKDKNLLGKEEIPIEVYLPKYLSSQDKSDIENYKKGMVLEHWEKNSLSHYTIVGTDKERNLLYIQRDKKQKVINLKKLDKNWSLMEKKTINISQNEKLISLGKLSKGSIQPNEELRVLEINKKNFVVVDQKGKKHSLLYKNNYKLDHDYVKNQSSTLNNDKIVFVALNNKSLSQNTLNKIIKTGSEIKLYSALDQEKTQSKLNRIKDIKLISERLKGNEYSSIEEAITGRKEQLFTEVQKAVNTAIGISQGSNVYFSINQVIAETLKTNSSLKLNEIKKEIEARIKEGNIHLITSANGLGQNIAVSNETYQQEKKIQSLIIKGINSEKPLLEEKKISEANLNHLTKGQKEATKHILTSTDRFIGIQGFAGVGKTTQLKSVLNELKANNSKMEVVGLAPTHRAVYELQSIGIKAQTISSFLVEAKEEINQNSNFSLNNKLFLIDESSMIGNKNITNLYEIISQYGGRGIFSGDSKQLLSIDSGAAFSFLQKHTELKFSVMKDIVRQNDSLKPAIYSLLNNQIRNSLSIINSINTDMIKRDKEFEQLGNVIDKKLLKEKEFESVSDYIAKDFASRDEITRNKTIIVTQLNKDKDQINQKIHNQLFELNKLGNTQHKISVLAPVLINENELNKLSTYEKNINNIVMMDKNYYQIESIDTNSDTVKLKNLDNKNSLMLNPYQLNQYDDISIYKNHKIMISEKDKILVNRTNIDRGFVANSEWIVSKIEKNQLYLTNNDGSSNKQIDLNNHEDLHFNFGYAKTDFSAQGASSSYAIVYEKFSNIRSFYVEISRAAEHITFITDNLDKWIERVDKKVDKIVDRLSATDILENQLSKQNQQKMDDIIKNEISEIDPNINLDEIKNKLNISELSTLNKDELISKIDEIINQEKVSINHKEKHTYDISDINHKKDDMVNNFINLTANDKKNELEKLIDEKTL